MIKTKHKNLNKNKLIKKKIHLRRKKWRGRMCQIPLSKTTDQI